MILWATPSTPSSPSLNVFGVMESKGPGLDLSGTPEARHTLERTYLREALSLSNMLWAKGTVSPLGSSVTTGGLLGVWWETEATQNPPSAHVGRRGGGRPGSLGTGPRQRGRWFSRHSGTRVSLEEYSSPHQPQEWKVTALGPNADPAGLPDGLQKAKESTRPGPNDQKCL